MKKRTATVPKGQPVAAASLTDSPDIKPASAAAAAPSPSGLDLLFAASQVDKSKPKNPSSDATAEVPSTITVVSNGGAPDAGDASGSSDAEEASASEYDENPTADALKIQKTFPQILQEILATPEYQPIAHWLPDGFSFIIADKRRFSDEILPKYFRVALFHSFIRKLNRWGFRRVKSRCKGEESSFAHNSFVRDKPWLCMKMKCKSKPSYHKIPSAKKKAQQAAAEAANSIASAAHLNGMVARAAAAPPLATVDIWQSIDPTKPFALQTTGINNLNGLTNQIGTHNALIEQDN